MEMEKKRNFQKQNKNKKIKKIDSGKVLSKVTGILPMPSSNEHYLLQAIFHGQSKEVVMSFNCVGREKFLGGTDSLCSFSRADCTNSLRIKGESICSRGKKREVLMIITFLMERSRDKKKYLTRY